MEKKKKIFYLDFIRVISMFIIVTFHFNIHFSDYEITGKMLLSNGKWGMIGVTLFLMISGAALMYNYGEKIDVKKYAKKRFLGIYPMFWVAYLLVFVYIFYGTKKMVHNDLPLYKLLISFIAMDGYLSPYTETFYILGEWFLGCIIFIYILFPLLRKIINSYPKIFLAVCTIINFSMIIFYKNGIMPINKNLIVCTYSFILGMYIIKYVKEIRTWQMIIALIFALLLYYIPNNDDLNINIKTLIANLIGYNLFIVLAYMGEKIKSYKIQTIFYKIGKYSYAIFLVHHYIIMKVEATFENASLEIYETILLYITCWVIIVIFAKLLYMINKKVLNLFEYEQKAKLIEDKIEKVKND